MEKLTIENAKKLNEYIQKAHYNEYNSNIVTMLMWQHVYEMNVHFHEQYALVLVNYHHHFGWLMPYCEEKYRLEALQAMKEYSFKHHLPFEIHGMNEEFKHYCETHDFPFIYHDDLDARDYVYDASMHMNLIGKRMQKRRNHFNAFMKEYENRFIFKTIDSSDFQNILYFLERWMNQHIHQDSLELEVIGIKYLLDHMEELQVSGGCIYIDGRLEAFCLTSLLSEDTLQIHVEKANHEIRGLYVALFKYTLMQWEGKITKVNREDDMGIPELRKAKQDLKPIFQIRKYAAFYGAYDLIQANEEYLPMMKKLWLDSFQEETALSTDYFFDHLFHYEDTTLLVHEKALIGMIQLRKMKIQYNGEAVTTRFIGGVAIHPFYQRCGYMKILMNHVLSQSQEPFLFIQAYNWDLYRPFGFHEAYQLKKVFYQRETKQTMIPECEDPALLLDIYQRYTADKNGFRIRDVKYFQHFINYMKLDGHIYANTDAYICISPTENGYLVSECAYTKLSSLTKLLDMFEGPLEVWCDLSCPLSQEAELMNRMFVRGDFKAEGLLYINEFL